MKYKVIIFGIFLSVVCFVGTTFAGEEKGGAKTHSERTEHPPHDHQQHDHLKVIKDMDKRRKRKSHQVD